MKHSFCLVFLILILPFISLQAQITNPNEAQVELQKLGISEDEIDKRLLERGINIQSIDPTNAQEVAEAEIAIQEVIAEIEAERAVATDASNNGATDTIPAATTAVEKTIQEEAEAQTEVIEEVIEKQQEALPESAIYGQELFRRDDFLINPDPADVKPTDNYLLGGGDEIGIAIFGQSVASFSFEISREGYIQPDRMGRIYLKGLTFGQAKKLLRRQFGQYYSFGSGEFAVTINYSRTITVNIVGNVLKPGSYTIPATNTAINALVAAGGPSDIGSLRNIKINSGDDTKTLDIYEFLQNPSAANSYFLQNNDYIYVPAREKLVTILGAVRRPLRYELLPNENLNQLISLASGLTDNAYQGNIQVKRFQNDEEKIIDVDYRNLKQTNADFTLQSGDMIVASSIPRPFQNFVSASGAVEYASKFELAAGMKVSDLLNKSKLLEEAAQEYAFLKRANTDGTIQYKRINLNAILTNPASTDNLPLLPQDELVVFYQSQSTDNFNFSVQGAVRNPDIFDYDAGQSLRVEEAILLAGGLRRDANRNFAYIIRPEPQTGENQYLRINIGEVMNNPASPDNIIIQPNDNLKIISALADIDETFVSVVGAVRTPGEYSWDETLTLQDVLSLSNGLKLSAASNRVEIFRLVITENQPTKTNVATIEVDENLNIVSGGGGDFALEPFDIIAVRNVPDFEFQKSIQITGEVQYDGSYPLISDNERIYSVIERAGGLSSEAFPAGATLFRSFEGVGFVIIDIDEVMNNPNSKFNVILKENDIIYIPSAKDLVAIVGATQASTLYQNEVASTGKLNVPFQKSKSARYYVNEYAAGFDENAHRKKVTVIHPNGEVKRTKDFGLFKIYPKVRKGSVVSIPFKQAKDRKENDDEVKEDIDWGKVLADSMAQATSIITLILLLERI